jgi:hypothetical protein
MNRIASLAVDVGGNRRVNGDAWVSPGGKGRVQLAADGRVHHFQAKMHSLHAQRRGEEQFEDDLKLKLSKFGPGAANRLRSTSVLLKWSRALFPFPRLRA